MKRALLALVLAGAAAGAAPSPAPLTLDEAVALALHRSRGAQLAQLQVEEAQADADAARRRRYPQVTAQALGAYLLDPLDIEIKQGSLTPALTQAGAQLGLGSLVGALGPFPGSDLTLARGSHLPALATLTVAQPLTQLWRIDSGVRAAEAGRREAALAASRTHADLRYAVEELFVGWLLEQDRVAEKAAQLARDECALADAEHAHQVGELLDDAVLGQRAAVAQARAALLRSRQQQARLALQLGDLIGRPGADDLLLVPVLPIRAEHPLDYWIAQAAANPDRLVAAAVVDKAAAGERAARQQRIPDVSLVLAGHAQTGIPLVSSHSGAVALTVSWDVLDFGRRDAAVGRARAQRRAAEVNRDRLEEEATRQLRLAYQDLDYAQELIGLAEQAVAYRRRAAELAQQSAAQGLALPVVALEAAARWRQAEAELAGARSQRHLALLRLHYLAGQL